MTDRPHPEAAAGTYAIPGENELHDRDGHKEDSTEFNEIVTSANANSIEAQQRKCTGVLYVSPSEIYPFPKAQPRKAKGGRKKNATRILTDTPIRDGVALETGKKDRVIKSSKKVSKRNLFGKRKASQKIAPDVTSSDDSEEECEMIEQSVAKDTDETSSEDEIIEGDFVVVSINSAKGTSQRYIARVDIIDGDELEGIFVKKMTGHRVKEEKSTFIIDHNDEASFHKQDDSKVLPPLKVFVEVCVNQTTSFSNVT